MRVHEIDNGVMKSEGGGNEVSEGGEWVKRGDRSSERGERGERVERGE